MNCKIDEVKTKPDDWPANPNYKNKEILISLITNYDLNQMSMIGLVRTTEYEVACINSLFFDANILQLNALKAYLYELMVIRQECRK